MKNLIINLLLFFYCYSSRITTIIFYINVTIRVFNRIVTFYYGVDILLTNHIVLFEPLIPANTGNIARTCAATNTILDLIKPLGFSTDDKHLKRAGLDYWSKVRIYYHNNLDEFLSSMSSHSKMFLISKFADKIYSNENFSDISYDYYFIFGRETTGLPAPFQRENRDKNLRIPMTDNVRSLNLSNCASIIIYEVLRQQNFKGLNLVYFYPNDKLK